MQRLGLLAPSLFAFGTAVRLVKILLRRAAQGLLTWWMPIRAVHHVARLCTTRLARCGVLEHRALHAVCALHPSQFGANFARGMIKGTIDAGRASWMQMLAVLCCRLRWRWRCTIPRGLCICPVVLCMRCSARSVRPSGRARALRLRPITVGLIEIRIRPNAFCLGTVPVIIVIALPCGWKTSTARRCGCRCRASRCSAGGSPVPVVVIISTVAARCIVFIFFFFLRCCRLCGARRTAPCRGITGRRWCCASGVHIEQCGADVVLKQRELMNGKAFEGRHTFFRAAAHQALQNRCEAGHAVQGKAMRCE